MKFSFLPESGKEAESRDYKSQGAVLAARREVGSCPIRLLRFVPATLGDCGTVERVF